MNTHQTKILKRLEQCPLVALQRPERMKPISEFAGLRSKIESFNNKFFNEIGWLFDVYPDIGIFCGSDYNRCLANAWDLSLLVCISTSLADTFMYGERRGDRGDYLFNYNHFATNMADGGIGLGIYADPSNFGRIACCDFAASSERSDVPIVANTFTEWLERTLDHGPDADCFYWELPDFVDLGPAIPGDPYYNPIGIVA